MFVTNSQVSPGQSVLVTVENFTRAESDSVFTGLVAQGGFGKFFHNRELAPDNHIVQRPNRDTLYSTGVFDLDAGPVTITLPDAGKRFMTMMVIDEDHYVSRCRLRRGHVTPSTRDKIGTRYALAAIRILVDPEIQRIWSRSTPCRMRSRSARRAPADSKCPTGTRQARRKCAMRWLCWAEPSPIGDTQPARRNEVDPVRHLIVPRRAGASIPTRMPSISTSRQAKNDGKTIYKLNVKDVPVDGFWSVSVYNAEGYFVPNKLNGYTLNNITAKKAAMARSRSSSAAATARSRTACRSCRVGTTWCDCIVRARRS